MNRLLPPCYKSVARRRFTGSPGNGSSLLQKLLPESQDLDQGKVGLRSAHELQMRLQVVPVRVLANPHHPCECVQGRCPFTDLDAYKPPPGSLAGILTRAPSTPKSTVLPSIRKSPSEVSS